MNRVQANLATTLLPVRLGRQVETAGWEGLVSLLTTGITGYTSVQQAQAEAEAAQAALEAERIRLAVAQAQAPGAKVSDFLRRYWPWLLGGTGGLLVLALAFRKPK